MKKLLLFCFISIFNVAISLSQAKVYTGKTYITTQSDLENLKGYEIIMGNLFLYGEKDPKDEITDLSPLSALKTIEGNLQIISTQITSFKGLENLKTIKGDVYISYNYKVTNASSLSLTNVSAFTFSFSPIVNLNLTDLKEVKSININNNKLLKTIELNHLSTVKFNFLVYSNDHLEKLSLPSLTFVGGELRISQNRNLSDCCHVNSLLNSKKAILGNIDISENKIGCYTKEEVLNVCR